MQTKEITYEINRRKPHLRNVILSLCFVENTVCFLRDAVDVGQRHETSLMIKFSNKTRY